jgi:hypothetical protein
MKFNNMRKGHEFNCILTHTLLIFKERSGRPPPSSLLTYLLLLLLLFFVVVDDFDIEESGERHYLLELMLYNILLSIYLNRVKLF